MRTLMRRIAALIVLGGLLGACGIAAAQKNAEDPLWRMVVLPDTQHYSQDYPEHFRAQTAWIRQEAEAGRIDLMVHVGDVVDENEIAQWQAADRALASLDGVVPYVLAAGNHDFAYDGSRNSYYSEYFPQDRLGLDGVYEEGRSENGYRIVTLGETEYLVLSLEVFSRDGVLNWARGVLAAHPETPVIITTHAYLYTDGKRYGEPGARDHKYGHEGMEHVTGSESGSANDAETVYRELVLPFPQVRYVLSGHVLGKGVAHRTLTRPDGSVVHEVLQNYQMRDEGGEGYLRIYEAYEDRVEVSTYSPVLEKWIRDAEHEFVLTP